MSGLRGRAGQLEVPGTVIRVQEESFGDDEKAELGG